jgi:hypothetical protein
MEPILSEILLPGETPWKTFERLCADLLTAEQFEVQSEPYVDRTGDDIIAIEEYRSHTQTRTFRVRWRVQCKYYSVSGNHFGRKEAEELMYHFEAVRKPGDALMLIVSTDYTEDAKAVIDGYAASRNVVAAVWNFRYLRTLLAKHSHIASLYRIATYKPDYVRTLAPLSRFKDAPVLIISDQSALAHNLTFALRTLGFDVTFLPFWNYVDPVRADVVREWTAGKPYRLIVCFLGDSFGIPLPEVLEAVILENRARGASLLLFPFLAWGLPRAINEGLSSVVPVAIDVRPVLDELDLQRMIGALEAGELGRLVRLDDFAEHQYTELDPANGKSPFTDGITHKFGLSHSFEYLTVLPGARSEWSTTSGNPVVVTREDGSKSCYLNTCSHSCFAPIAIPSPLEVSHEAGLLIRNILLWLLT